MDKRGESVKESEEREKEEEEEACAIWPYDRPGTRSFCYDLEIWGKKSGVGDPRASASDTHLAIVGSLDPCWHPPDRDGERRIGRSSGVDQPPRPRELWRPAGDTDER